MKRGREGGFGGFAYEEHQYDERRHDEKSCDSKSRSNTRNP